MEPAIATSKEPAWEPASAVALCDALGLDRSAGRTRTPEQVEALKDRIAFLARVFSRNYDMTLVPSAEGLWACGIDPAYSEQINRFVMGDIDSIDELPPEAFKAKELIYSLKDMEQSPEIEILGVLRHEVGHALHTDYRLLFKGQREAVKEGFLPTSWLWIMNCLEDPWVNNKEIADSKVVREQMKAKYDAAFPEIIEKAASLPPTLQLGMNLNYYWATGKSIPTIKDQEVLKVFEQIRPFADKYFVAPAAQENYDNLRQNIWPIYRALEQKAMEDEALKELARAASGSSMGRSQGGQQEKPQGFFSKLKRMIFGDGEKDQEAKGNQEALKRAAEERMDRQAREQLRSELEQQEKQQGQPKTPGAPGARAKEIDLARLSPAARKQLEELKKQLSPEQQQALGREARRNVDQKQADELKGKLPKQLKLEKDSKTGDQVATLNMPPTPKDLNEAKEELERICQESDQRREARAQAEQEAERQAQTRNAELLKKQREREEMRREGFDEDEFEAFRKFKRLEQSMLARIREFLKVLDKYLPKKQHLTHEGEYYSGAKLNIDAVPKRAPVRDYRLYQRKQRVESTEPRMFIRLLIDNSGSMSGQKMDESLKTGIFWARVLKNFNIPFSIQFFGDRVTEVMNFNQEYDDPREKIKPRLVAQADACGGGTNMGTPLKRTHEEMLAARRKFRGCKGAVFVISDSGANMGTTGAPLRKLIEEMQKELIVQNFILSSSAEEKQEAKEYFGEGNVIAPRNFSALPEEAFKVLRTTLMRLLKRYRT